MTANQGTSLAQGAPPVNGTTTRTDWNSVNWRQANANVRRLRQRIFRASQVGDFKKVRSLQKLMLRSYSNRLTSVRRVTQQNAGSQTAGVDKVVCKTPESRGKLVDDLATYTPWHAKPAKRVYIPKTNGKLRPLGIPVIRDRALQAMVKNALEPEWEARFEGTSYGFRPGRSCHDAIARIFTLALPTSRKQWILDADIQGAFDHICHDHLLATIGATPGRNLIRQWLKAGYVEMGNLHPTEAGTPQGGVISPLLANIALHGMEDVLGIKYTKRGHNRTRRAVVRYADDFVVFCETQEDAQQVKDLLTTWLTKRGLTLSEDKTRIVHLTKGFDFLSFNIRHYKVTTCKAGYKLFIKPSKTAVQKLRDKMREVWLSLRGQNADVVCRWLNPITRGWANYFRIAVSARTFHTLDAWMFRRTVTHVHHKHPHKSWKWLRHRYWGRFHPQRADNWVFGDKTQGDYLLKFAWYPIERHVLVKGTASPDNPTLRAYWERRRLAKARRLTSMKKRVIALNQHGKCPICGETVVDDDTESAVATIEEVHLHHKNPRKQGGGDSWHNLQLLHLFCHQQIHAGLKDERDQRETTDV